MLNYTDKAELKEKYRKLSKEIKDYPVDSDEFKKAHEEMGKIASKLALSR